LNISAPATAPVIAADKRRKAMLIVVFCTFIGAAAQVFIKAGANRLTHPGFIGAIVGILTNPRLFCGYALYGVFTVLLVYALREAELSILYPIIALTYVWVAILSVIVFQEKINVMKTVGIVTIVGGVAILGRGSKR
jgi:multidrug transporter EmrE-like cation transporter